jgi:hypothetical protein
MPVGAVPGVPGVPASAPAPGAGAGHPSMPLPSRDNVVPGASNPHGGAGLKLQAPSGEPELGLKLRLPPSLKTE